MLPFCPNDFDDNNITKIAARAEESRQLARVHTLRAQDKDRRRYDSKHQMVSYAPGDLVWVYTPVRKVGLSEKLLRRYFGPYQVLRRLSAVTYEVQDFDPASRKRKLREVVHVLRMKPYHDPAEQIETEDIPPKESYKGPITPELAERWTELPQVSDESRSFFRVHTSYFSNIPKCIKAEFIASWACSQSSVVSSSQHLTVDGVVGLEGDNDEVEKSTPLTRKLIQGLQLCSKLENHFLINDPNSERASKFQRELQNCMSGYRELYKKIKESSSQSLITDYIVRKGRATQNENEVCENPWLLPQISIAETVSSDDEGDLEPLLKWWKPLSHSDND
ncbi:transposon Ty3-I Gag-Pol polyprotein [Trichonephila clavipes]|nr:transposon Ty3-I Gag-Pol polyprotein [Trichonephila clavipes]